MKRSKSSKPAKSVNSAKATAKKAKSVPAKKASAKSEVKTKSPVKNVEVKKTTGKTKAAATMHNAFAVESIIFDEETFDNLEKKINPKKSFQK